MAVSTWQMTPYTVPFVVSAAVAIVVFGIVARNRTERAAVPLLGVLSAAFIWVLAVTLQLSSTTEGAKLFWNNVRFLGPSLAAPSIFLFVAAFTDHEEWLDARRVALLLVPTLLVNLAAWTNYIHGLFRLDTTVVAAGSFAMLDVTWGPLFVVHVLYHYTLLLWTLYWLAVEYFSARSGGTKTHLTQVWLILFALVSPWAANVAFAFGITAVDLTPIGFAATGALFATGLFRYRLLDLLPIARSTVIDSMDNGVLVVDTDDRIVDVNPHLRSVFGLDGADLIGTDIQSAFRSHPTLVESLTDVQQGNVHTDVRIDGEMLHYEINVSPLRDTFEETVGRAIVLSDVTEEVVRRRELAVREEELDLMRQVQSRVLRHNIRNDLQVIKANNEKLAAELDGDLGERAQRTLAKADELLDTSRKTRAIERFLDDDQTSTTVDLDAVLRETVMDARESFPKVTFTFETLPESRVETLPAIRLVFENVIENAAEHNDNATPVVEVSVEEHGTYYLVRVRDNGPGIPSQELDVIERGEETALQHSRGLGMWVVDWVITNTASSIEFDTGEEGTEARIEIPHDPESTPSGP